MEKLEQIDEKRDLSFTELTSYIEQYHKLDYLCSVEITHEAVNSYGSVQNYYRYTLKVFKVKE